MKKGNLAGISLVLVFVVLIFSTGSSIAQETELQSIEGNVFCIELDDQGNMVTKEEWTMCKGTLVAVGADGKAYVISGTVEETKKIMAAPGKKETVSGVVSGHERGWILAAASAEHPKPAVTSTEDIKVTGTIVCLLPNYQAANFKQVVATGPCNEVEQHVHVVRTSDGQVYALHGSEEAIKKIEGMSERKEVEIQGKIQGEQGAWTLFVQ